VIPQTAKGGLEADSVAGWLCDNGGGGEGGEQQPSICGICLLLANTATRA
jgi:hypothetical protein